jgi:hypothetical protein
MTPDTLSIWSVYHSPLDYPSQWVARRFLVGGGLADPQPTTDMFVADSLEEVRALLPPGLTRIPRSPIDHPVVVESWL